MNVRLKALRGAVNFIEDSSYEIATKTEELFRELFSLNKLEMNDIVCVIFSLTEDIKAAYPAKTFRDKFSSDISLFSCSEPMIENGLPMTLRVMILHYGELNKPVYLYETKKLRKDLFV